MKLYFVEDQTDHVYLGVRITDILHVEQTPYQKLAVVETVEYGRMLVLDGAIQCTERDEFLYHEMIAHVPLHVHPNPKRVCVIGGGDGGTVREVLRHPSVEEVKHVEIDGAVIEASKKYFPTLSTGFADPRVEVLVTDGVEYIKNTKDYFDVVIIDSTDPVGPAVGLFSQEYYGYVNNALREDGVICAQTESPFANKKLLLKCWKNMRVHFPHVGVTTGYMPTYPTGYWSYTVGSKKHELKANREVNIRGKYFTETIMSTAFDLPPFLEEMLKNA
ncbi:MAG TPA: polyamine aminopropyltransferase [Firmicutes bacterium]|nr:polyamine aminopropyltransferase [Bacillota bacterium]